jgi:hypothetical protein
MTCEPFADRAACSTTSSIDLQLAIAGEFGPEDAVATHGLLDDFALALFGMAGSEPHAQADRLMRLMARELHFAVHGDDPEQLLLPRVVATRRGHPLMLAIVASELAQRAGIAVTVYSSPERWFVGFDAGDHVLLLDAALADSPQAPTQVRAHCRHELAYWTLTAISRGFVGRGQLVHARRATRLKLALPIGDALRAEVGRELDALGGPNGTPGGT